MVDESCVRDEFNSTVFVEIGTQDGGLKRAITILGYCFCLWLLSRCRRQVLVA